MRICKYIVLFSLFISPFSSAAAQRHETFGDRPSKRQDRVRQAHERYTREKNEARQWAKAHGIKMRYDEGRRHYELMALRKGRPVYYVTDNANAAISTAADQVRNTAPFSVNGAGVTVGVWDAGAVRPDHQEFGGRVTIKDGAANSDHSTHVGGTIGASGVQGNARGMAPNVSIHSYSWDNDESEMAAAAAATAWEPGKIMLSNHSYGLSSGWEGNYWFGITWGKYSQDDTFGRYSDYCREWDEILYDAPYELPFVSAGNDRNDDAPYDGALFYYYENNAWHGDLYDSSIHPKGDGVYNGGYDTISDKALCKNTLTVGAVNDAVSGGTRFLPTDMTSFSSWGPADDGRIKPDIVANGAGVYSCIDSSTSSYASESGTSMATPNACGSAVLLVDYYRDRFPGQAMRASMLKGLIIHTADDLGNPGPDYSYGWGLMNTLAAAELIKDYADGNSKRMTEGVLYSGTNTSAVSWFFSGGAEPIRVTLCWTDPPGVATTNSDSRIPVLVNDLDLKVTGPGGTYYPYKLNYNNPVANATANSENDIDNVEQVFIAAPAAGEYIVTIDYDGPLTGEMQPYSLLISGTDADSDADGMSDYWETTYFFNATGAVATADSDGDGLDNLSEFISGHNPRDSASVFRIAAFYKASPTTNHYALIWNPVAGRVCNISWVDNLAESSFTNISGDLYYPINSFTDTVDRAGEAQFYRIEIR